MKKLAFLVATLGAATGAYAQSSVTLAGIVDNSLTHGSGSVSSRTSLANSANSTSRLIFRGVEDLGGGMSAQFWLEAGLLTDDGQGQATNSNNQPAGTGAAVAGRQGLTFNRRSTVALATDYGELRLGRDYTPQYTSNAKYDPYSNLGVGASQISIGSIAGPTQVRASNSIAYHTSPKLGALYATAMYYMGENNTGAATSRDGTGGGVRVLYDTGGYSASAAWARTRFATGDITSSNLGGDYTWNDIRFMVFGQRDHVDNAIGLTGKGVQVGVVANVGPGQLKGSWSTYKTSAVGEPKSTRVAVGYVYNLSKRAALYGTFAHLKNGGGATQSLAGSVTAPNGSSNGYDLGLRFAF